MFAGKWRGELHVTLTALECISGMAQLDPKFIGKLFFELLVKNQSLTKKFAFKKNENIAELQQVQQFEQLFLF